MEPGMVAEFLEGVILILVALMFGWAAGDDRKRRERPADYWVTVCSLLGMWWLIFAAFKAIHH